MVYMKSAIEFNSKSILILHVRCGKKILDNKIFTF